jgi:hypothetical protein
MLGGPTGARHKQAFLRHVFGTCKAKAIPGFVGPAGDLGLQGGGERFAAIIRTAFSPSVSNMCRYWRAARSPYTVGPREGKGLKPRRICKAWHRRIVRRRPPGARSRATIGCGGLSDEGSTWRTKVCVGPGLGEEGWRTLCAGHAAAMNYCPGRAAGQDACCRLAGKLRWVKAFVDLEDEDGDEGRRAPPEVVVPRGRRGRRPRSMNTRGEDIERNQSNLPACPIQARARGWCRQAQQ